MAVACESRFEGKVDSPLCTCLDFREHQTAGSKGDFFRIGKREALCDLVGVNEARASRLFRKEGLGKCGFAGAIGSGNDVDIWAHLGSHVGLIRAANLGIRGGPEGEGQQKNGQRGEGQQLARGIERLPAVEQRGMAEAQRKNQQDDPPHGPDVPRVNPHAK